MHQALQGATFHVEHVLPGSRGGPTSLGNLAWSCPQCNLKKADRIVGVDSESGNQIRLFNPRTDHWDDHFQWDEYRIVGLTPVGRATVAVLDLNHPRRALIRHAEELFGLFRPD